MSRGLRNPCCLAFYGLAQEWLTHALVRPSFEQSQTLIQIKVKAQKQRTRRRSFPGAEALLKSEHHQNSEVPHRPEQPDIGSTGKIVDVPSQILLSSRETVVRGSAFATRLCRVDPGKESEPFIVTKRALRNGPAYVSYPKLNHPPGERERSLVFVAYRKHTRRNRGDG
jgi:hypothetical protein